MPRSVQTQRPVLTTRRQQAAARDLLASVARGEVVTDFTFITDRLATGGCVETEADVATVVEAGIDTLIDCRAEFVPHAARFKASLATAHPQIAYHVVPTLDDGEPKGPLWFEAGIRLALAALERPEGRVLVYCQAGVNRGPSMLYAIMRALGIAGDEAVGLLSDRRPVVGLRYRADADTAITWLGYGLPSSPTGARPVSLTVTHGWHFAATTGAAPVGVTEYWDGRLIPNKLGLHGSERALDALTYMPTAVGRTAVLVRWCAFSGALATGDREFVASERTTVWSADATLVLRDFAAWCYEDLERQAGDMTASQAARKAATCSLWKTELWSRNVDPVTAAVGASLTALGGPAHFLAGDRATVMARWRYSLHLESLLEKLSPGHEHEAEELRAAKEDEDAKKAADAREAKEGIQAMVGAAWRMSWRLSSG